MQVGAWRLTVLALSAQGPYLTPHVCTHQADVARLPDLEKQLAEASAQAARVPGLEAALAEAAARAQEEEGGRQEASDAQAGQRLAALERQLEEVRVVPI